MGSMRSVALIGATASSPRMLRMSHEPQRAILEEEIRADLNSPGVAQQGGSLCSGTNES